MRTILCLTLLCVAVPATLTFGVVQPPIGFERWEAPPVGPAGEWASGVDFGLTPAKIYQKYAAQLLIGLPASGLRHQQKDMRLIDIEVRADGSGLGVHLYDVVWVRNEGSFLLDSWLVTGLTAAEVELFQQFDDVIILDIERYTHGTKEWRFAIILQRNSGKFDWEVLLDVDYDTAIQAAHASGTRAVDVDRFFACGPRSAGGDCQDRYDVVLVDNAGSNLVPTIDFFQASIPYSIPGYQITDFEINALGIHTTNWVLSGNPYIMLSGQSEDDVIHNHNHRGRVIDLEVVQVPTMRPGFGSTISYWTVNLTNQ
jgi:hypothetical protein